LARQPFPLSPWHGLCLDPLSSQTMLFWRHTKKFHVMWMYDSKTDGTRFRHKHAGYHYYHGGWWYARPYRRY
jgi:hypothetical protein